jgi:Ca2+-transporting ATPase
VKGAPEYVIGLCTQTLSNDVTPIAFQENEQLNVLEHIVSRNMAQEGLKCLSYAFKEIKIQDLDSLMKSADPESEEFRDALEEDLIYVATFGMEDPLRTNIHDSIQYIRYGQLDGDGDQPEGNQVNIRMVTGDHIETAKRVAIETGIVKAEEVEIKGVVMTGDQFRDSIGGYNKIWDPNHNEFRVEF